VAAAAEVVMAIAAAATAAAAAAAATLAAVAAEAAMLVAGEAMLPNFGRGCSVKVQNLGKGNTMEVRVATTINGIDSVIFITILPRVSIISLYRGDEYLLY
jgi:hypothetical protein